jgi:hypothetical protein
MQLSEDLLVLLNMLENIKASYDVEFIFEGYFPGIHLEEICIPYSGRRKCESAGMNIAPVQAYVRKRPFDSRQNKTSSTADFEKCFYVREIPCQGPLDQAISRSKPEIPRFYVIKVREGFRFKAGISL